MTAQFNYAGTPIQCQNPDCKRDFLLLVKDKDAELAKMFSHAIAIGMVQGTCENCFRNLVKDMDGIGVKCVDTRSGQIFNGFSSDNKPKDKIEVEDFMKITRQQFDDEMTGIVEKLLTFIMNVGSRYGYKDHPRRTSLAPDEMMKLTEQYVEWVVDLIHKKTKFMNDVTRYNYNKKHGN